MLLVLLCVLALLLFGAGILTTMKWLVLLALVCVVVGALVVTAGAAWVLRWLDETIDAAVRLRADLGDYQPAPATGRSYSRTVTDEDRIRAIQAAVRSRPGLRITPGQARTIAKENR